MGVARYGFLLSFGLPPLVVAGWWLGGGWNFLLPMTVWGVLPALDWWLGPDTRNPAPDAADALECDPFYRRALLLQAAVVIGLIAWACSVAPTASALEFLGLALSTGLVAGGTGIVVAHELGHRRGAVDRFAAHALLAFVGYMHFFIEHNKGHHAKVGTPDDPATARPGEGFWSFFPRTLVGQYRSALTIDQPRTLAYTAVSVTVALAFGAVFGAAALGLFALQAFYAVLQLELTNYVEHYGLQRAEIAPGRYERVALRHSWNSSSRLSNLLLFNLQRHAHHHINVGKPYQALEHYDESPQLPAGYLAMLPLATVPPLWRRVMARAGH